MFAKRETLLSKILIILILLIVVLWVVVPIYIVASNSIRPTLEIKKMPPSLIFKPTLTHYEETISVNEFGGYFINSLIVAAITTAISVICGAMGGYGLFITRRTWGGRLSNFILVGKLVPSITILIPFYLMLSFLHLNGTYVGPILAHCSVNLPFVIWLMLGFIKDVPESLFDAALIDGATRMKTFWSVLLPLLTPAIGSAFILSMQYSWNELLFSLQLTSLDTYTLPVGVARYVGAVAINWGKGSAAATITMLPIIIVGFAMQKYFVSGMTSGAVKE